MARIEAITARGIALHAARITELQVARPDFTRAAAHDDVTQVQLWRRSAPVTHVSPEADAWFTTALGVPCRLMAFAPEGAAFNVPPYEVHSSLQDATPFHLTTEESLADLNDHAPLDQAVYPVRRDHESGNRRASATRTAAHVSHIPTPRA